MAESAEVTAPPVTLAECPPRGRINLRGDPEDPAFTGAVAAVLGVDPPVAPGAVRPGEGARILWFGPDEWLVETDREDEVAGRLEEALAGLHAAVTIVGDGSVTFALAGPRAPDVLAKGMTLDLDRLGAGCCARSLLAKAPVLLHRTAGEDGWEITVARSFADYVRRWLADAALEYGLRP